MRRVRKRYFAKALRREYVRERGRSDRCWDDVYIGRRAVMNAMRIEFGAAALAMRRTMNLRLWGAPEPEMQYVPPPGSRTRRVKLETKHG